MRGAITFLYGWLLVLTLLLAFAFVQQGRDRHAARADNRAVWRLVICKTEDATLKNPRVTARQRQEAIKFWTEVLVDLVHTQPCD